MDPSLPRTQRTSKGSSLELSPQICDIGCITTPPCYPMSLYKSVSAHKIPVWLFAHTRQYDKHYQVHNLLQDVVLWYLPAVLQCCNKTLGKGCSITLLHKVSQQLSPFYPQWFFFIQAHSEHKAWSGPGLRVEQVGYFTACGCGGEAYAH